MHTLLVLCGCQMSSSKHQKSNGLVGVHTWLSGRVSSRIYIGAVHLIACLAQFMLKRPLNRSLRSYLQRRSGTCVLAILIAGNWSLQSELLVCMRQPSPTTAPGGESTQEPNRRNQSHHGGKSQCSCSLRVTLLDDAQATAFIVEFSNARTQRTMHVQAPNGHLRHACG